MKKNTTYNERNLLELLNDTRMCLVWLRILENDYFYKDTITTVIQRIDAYIENEIKNKYN